MNRISYLSKEIFKSRLFANYVHLSIFQIVNFLVPLVTVPFIIKYIGIANYGHIAFSYAFITYFTVLTDYGFNMSATRSISINRHDKEKVSHIFSTVLLTKLLFFALAFILFSLLVLLVPFFREYALLHMGSFTLVLAQVVMPVWLFQGIEDMKYLAIANTFSKLLFAILIISFIRRQEDYIFVNILQGIGGILAGLICIRIIVAKLKIKFVRVTAADIKHEIKEGWLLFLSSFAVNIYLNSNAFILGMFTNATQLGFYSIAEKVYLVVKQLNGVFSQVIYPQICVVANQSIEHLKSFLKKIFLPFAVLIILVCTTAFVFAPFICEYFLKQVDPHEVMLIRIFCFVPVIVAFDIPAFQSLLALNKKKQYGSILIAGCVLNLLLNTVLVHFLNALGTTLSVLLTELFITISLNYAFLKVANQGTKLL